MEGYPASVGFSGKDLILVTDSYSTTPIALVRVHHANHYATKHTKYYYRSGMIFLPEIPDLVYTFSRFWEGGKYLLDLTQFF